MKANTTIQLDLSNLKFDPADARLGLPSASAAPILVHCPGAWRMQQGRADLHRFEKLADSGTRIHNHLNKQLVAGDEPLTLEESRKAKAMEDNCDDLVKKWESAYPDKGLATLVDVEQRLYLRSGIFPVTSGQYDRLYRQGDRALIVDFKTGWADTGTTEENEQLLVYALLVHAHYNMADVQVSEISVAIVREAGKPYYHTYTQNTLESARLLWEKTLKEVFSEDPALVAGSHCQFCKAQTCCPAKREQVTRFRYSAENFQAKWEIMSPVEKVELYKLWKEITGFGKSLEDAIKADMKVSPLPGLSYGNGRTLVNVTDADKAFATVTKLGLDREGFMAACKVSFAQLRDALADKLGWKKKDAAGAAKKLLADCIEETTTEPSLQID